MKLHSYCPVGGNCSNHTECDGSCAPYVAKPHAGIAALIHKGVADAKPLCDSIKRLQKFTGKGLTPASPPDKLQPSTDKNLNAAKLGAVVADVFGSRLARVATASNGESFFSRIQS